MSQKGGNKALNIIIYILAVIGAVTIIFLIIQLGLNFSSSATTADGTIDNDSTNPPLTYMNEGGRNCPDYWINISNNNGKNNCRNTYKIPNVNGEVQYSESFPLIEDSEWMTSEKADLSGVKSRCNWLNGNGNAWQGISQYC